MLNLFIGYSCIHWCSQSIQGRGNDIINISLEQDYTSNDISMMDDNVSGGNFVSKYIKLIVVTFSIIYCNILLSVL